MESISSSSRGLPRRLVLAVRVLMVVVGVLVGGLVYYNLLEVVVLSGGTRRPNDTMLFEEKITDSPAIYKKAENEGCFPKVNNQPCVIITAFSVLDLGRGGSVKLTSGGPNTTQVCFRYQAKKPMKGFEFLTTVWGLNC